MLNFERSAELSSNCSFAYSMHWLLPTFPLFLVITISTSLIGLCRSYLSLPSLRGLGDLPLAAGRGRGWSRTEMEKLVNLHAQGIPLAEIAAQLNRSAVACKSRYSSHRPHLYWSDERKEAVLSLVVVLGEDWEAIGRETHLTARHCRVFYLEVLRGQRSDSWTAEEDRRLLEHCAVESGLHSDVLATTSWRNVSHILNRPSIACRKR